MSTNGKTALVSTKTATKTAPPSPKSGYALPLGNHPGNTGGKPGRSGRKPQDFRTLCGEAVDQYARPKAEAVLRDQLPYTADGVLNATWWAAANYLARYGQPEPPKEVAAKVAHTVILKAVRE